MRSDSEFGTRPLLVSAALKGEGSVLANDKSVRDRTPGLHVVNRECLLPVLQVKPRLLSKSLGCGKVTAYLLSPIYRA